MILFAEVRGFDTYPNVVANNRYFLYAFCHSYLTPNSLSASLIMYFKHASKTYILKKET